MNAATPFNSKERLRHWDTTSGWFIGMLRQQPECSQRAHHSGCNSHPAFASTTHASFRSRKVL